MIIKSFVFTGIVCVIAQIIKDNTKLTSGHITSLFVSIGALLGFLGVYDKLVKFFGGGASVVIMSFGNTLYNGAVKLGILNMLGNAFCFRSVFAPLVVLLLLAICYGIRIKVEEKALYERFGEDFKNYCFRTWRLIPLIW